MWIAPGFCFYMMFLILLEYNIVSLHKLRDLCLGGDGGGSACAADGDGTDHIAVLCGVQNVAVLQIVQNQTRGERVACRRGVDDGGVIGRDTVVIFAVADKASAVAQLQHDVGGIHSLE